MSVRPASAFIIPALPMHRTLRSRPRFLCITRKVSDLRHYPPGTDKEAARAIRKKEKLRNLRQRRRERDIPRGFGDRTGVGIFPLGSAERTEAEREARFKHIGGMPGTREALFEYTQLLGGGVCDDLLMTLRARWLERAERESMDQEVRLTTDVKHLYGVLIEEIIKCDEMYYNDDPKPRVSDAEYDELVMHLLELERYFPHLILPRSPSQTVGHGAAARATKLGLDAEVHGNHVTAGLSFYGPANVTTKRFEQHRHMALMLSLDNAYKHQDLVTFAKRASDVGSKLISELKIDGVALSLEYRKGRLHLAATRGTGRIGDDITDNVREALIGRGILQDILGPDVPDYIIVRGEVYISAKDFAEINADLSKPLSNPRNAAAGALKHKDPKESKARRLQFVAYECLAGNLEDIEKLDGQKHGSEGLPKTWNAWPTQTETLSRLSDWGFGRMPRYATCATIKEAEAFALKVEEDRKDLPMEVDGIVFKLDDSAAREAVGHTARAPKGAIAYKFAAQARVTTMNDVVMQVSRTGIITPVAILEPVRVGGALLSRATLHNFDEIRRLGVAVGDEVRVERGGDVIPKVIQVENKSKASDRVVIQPPDECPFCGGEVTKEKASNTGAVLIACNNVEKCSAQALGRLVHFCGRDAMDVKGLGVKTAQKLIDTGVVVVLADIFRMTIDDILSLSGYAEKSARLLFDSIQGVSKSRSLERLIVGLGLPGIGQTAARSLALKVGSIEGILQIATDPQGHETMMAVANIGEKTALAVHEYLQREQTKTELRALASHVTPSGVVNEEVADSKAADEVPSITGKSFAFTGKFVSMKRPAVMKWIKRSGGRVQSDVSKKTNFVISGLDPGNKFFKAQRLNVRIIPEEEFFTSFNVTPEEQDSMLPRVQDDDVEKERTHPA